MNAARRWCAHCTHGGPFLRTAAAAAAEGAVAAASAAVLAAAIRRQQSWQQASRHGRRSRTAGGTAETAALLAQCWCRQHAHAWCGRRGSGGKRDACVRVCRCGRRRRWQWDATLLGPAAAGRRTVRTGPQPCCLCVLVSAQAAHSAAKKITYSAPRVLVTRLVRSRSSSCPCESASAEHACARAPPRRPRGRGSRSRSTRHVMEDYHQRGEQRRRQRQPRQSVGGTAQREAERRAVHAAMAIWLQWPVPVDSTRGVLARGGSPSHKRTKDKGGAPGSSPRRKRAHKATKDTSGACDRDRPGNE